MSVTTAQESQPEYAQQMEDFLNGPYIVPYIPRRVKANLIEAEVRSPNYNESKGDGCYMELMRKERSLTDG